MTSSQMSLKDIMTSKVEDDSNESKCLIIFIDEMDSLISKVNNFNNYYTLNKQEIDNEKRMNI